jgi:hypothetical protein
MNLVEYELREIKKVPSIAEVNLESIIFYICIFKNHEKNLSAHAYQVVDLDKYEINVSLWVIMIDVNYINVINERKDKEEKIDQ